MRHVKTPRLRFHALLGYTKILYDLVKHNPDFTKFTLFEPEDIFKIILIAKTQLELVWGVRKSLLSDLSRYAGFSWTEREIGVYLTFLFPSFSKPLNLRVVNIEDGRLVPREPNQVVRVLLHELGHRLVSPEALQSVQLDYEAVVELLALKVMQKNKMIKSEVFKSYERRVGLQLFQPTIAAFIKNAQAEKRFQ